MILWKYRYIQMNQILYIKRIQFFVHQLYLNKAIMHVHARACVHTHTHTHTHRCFCMLALGPLHAFSIVFTLLEVEEAPGDGIRWQGQCPG